MAHRAVKLATSTYSRSLRAELGRLEAPDPEKADRIARYVGILLSARRFEDDVAVVTAWAQSGQSKESAAIAKLMVVNQEFDDFVAELVAKPESESEVTDKGQTTTYPAVFIGPRTIATAGGSQRLDVFVQPTIRKIATENGVVVRRELWVVAPDDGAKWPHTADNSLVLRTAHTESCYPGYTTPAGVDYFSSLLEEAVSHPEVKPDVKSRIHAPIPVSVG